MKKISLTQNQEALVDAEDYAYLNQWKWYFSGGYARRKDDNDNKKIIHMHRVITDCPKDKSVDHIDGNRLNNSKSNLRICSHRENIRNQKPQKRKKSSIFKGVYLHSGGKCWVATIKFNKKSIHLGTFETEQEAAFAYDIAAIKYFGDFAKTNGVF